MKLGWEATGSGVMCEGSPYRVTRKDSETRQKSKTEQGRRKDVREERGVPRGKCAAKGRIIWRKGGADNAEVGRQWERI